MSLYYMPWRDFNTRSLGSIFGTNIEPEVTLINGQESFGMNWPANVLGWSLGGILESTIQPANMLGWFGHKVLSYRPPNRGVHSQILFAGNLNDQENYHFFFFWAFTKKLTKHQQIHFFLIPPGIYQINTK